MKTDTNKSGRLLGGIGRHNRLKICRLLGVPVRVRQQAPFSFFFNFKLEKVLISVNDHAFNPKILREYDIRGTIGDSLSTKDAFLLGQRFGQVMVEQNLKIICVGRDGRLSSESLSIL